MATVQCGKCKEEFEAKRSDTEWCPGCRAIRAKERYLRYDLKSKQSCPTCGQPMVRRAELCLRCSNKARGEKRRGRNNGFWRGGLTNSKGYRYLRVGNGSGAGAYKAEHRLVWEQHNGPIKKTWVVHHLNGIKTDNRIENLVAMPRQYHHSHPHQAKQAYEERIRYLEGQLAS